MATVLYITAHPFDNEEVSRSLTVGNAFVNAYREANPEDEIVHLDLYKANVPLLDADILSRWGQPPTGPAFEQLSPESQAKSAHLWGLLEQFIAADKVIVANPVWNFSIPAILKAYIDVISMPGVTFKPSNNGLRGLGGLEGTQGKKRVVHIQASGTVLSHGEFQDVEFSHSYLKAVLKLMGVEFIEAIYVEGTHQYPEQAQEIKDQALERAAELAKIF
ncbi:FMN-dependent NADH-azoreductase [Paenibacillus sp. GCM10012307]|uniref:FMN dependent NADH:quinone oxidoreductase n=1 Tax=Paenibacillus roseus TaxID=2798579 RepID=A0A934J7G8_9BACL|nr:NAD(P)H-dependent oxidoreductase [Paenibacillus roseus]MBJ6364335.1 NAD(P)H-dependent oxidoreductase [Paenibacillus roseus]